METASCPRWYHDSGVCHGTAIRDGQPAGLPQEYQPETRAGVLRCRPWLVTGTGDMAGRWLGT